MNSQTIFDTVVRHLWAQGKQAADDNGSCLYRGPNGTKCAVGILIPDDKYLPRMDQGRGLVNVLDEAGIPAEHYALLLGLQRVHDKNGSWCASGPNENMVSALAEVARVFNLNTDVLP